RDHGREACTQDAMPMPIPRNHDHLAVSGSGSVLPSMGGDPSGDDRRAFDRLQSMPSVASGRALILSMLVLLVGDVIGGFFAVAYSDVHSWNAAWGFDAKTTVPLPIGAAQLLLAWLAARDKRPPIGLIAAVLLSAFCLISLMA